MQQGVCSDNKVRVCAGIVLYNPNIERLVQNIDSIVNQVDDIVLVDNGSSNISMVIQVINEKYANIINFKLCKENRGIAWALNRIFEYARDMHFDWFITLDQDSVCFSELVRQYLKYVDKGIGQITCNITDRHMGQLDCISFAGNKIREIEHCITSGCINQTNAISLCGGYDESLFIDGVDIDISCNLRQHGYKLIQIDYDGLLHELGDGITKNFLGKKISISNHLPWRNYYARRNLIYVARKYYKGFIKFKLIIRQIIYAIGTILLEDKKLERLRCNVKGVIDGMKMKI